MDVIKQKECECATWCDVNVQHRLLTGHSQYCVHSPKALDCALKLIKELVEGIREWGCEDDGVPYDLAKAYRRGAILTGVEIYDDE
jgi:hypothetical protein